MLKDIVIIKIEAGSGGAGSSALFANTPVGGDGGNGGDLYFRGNRNLYDLGHIDSKKRYKAENGDTGQGKNKNGENGKDLIIDLPLTTEVWDEDNLLHIIDQDGLTFKMLSGGIGAFGNLSRKKQYKLTERFKPTAGENLRLKLVLKLKSDAIFIGYPNAGKSSMLNALTNSNVKTAPYAFTTLDPQLGLMDGIRLMDLPGLIDGTHEGKGLGTRFLKHTESAKLLIHFISLENESLFETYNLMRAELKSIDPKLISLKEIVVITKKDLIETSLDKGITGRLNVAMEDFAKVGIKPLVTSIVDSESTEELKLMIRDALTK